MKKFSKLLALVLALSMALSLAACGGEKAPAETNAPAAPAESGAPAAPAESTGAAFKLGVIGPLTGGAAIYGTNVANAAQIAVDEINALGGIQFELNAQDDEHDAEKSVNAYNALKDWGMQILVGTVTSAPGIAVSSESNADRIFTLTPSASDPKVAAGKDNVYQMCFSDPNQGSASAKYITNQNLGSKIAVIYNNGDSYSTGIYQTFAAEAETLGLEVVSVTTFPDDNTTDFSVQLGEAQAAGADLLFLPIYYTPASLIMAQANTMGYAPAIFGVDGMDGILTMEGFNTALAEGVMLLTPFNADSEDERTQAFVAKYNELYGAIPNQFAADAYDCVYALYDALTQAGITSDASNEEICDALMGIFNGGFTFDGLTGAAMSWNEAGEVSKEPKGMVIQNGAYVGMD